MSEAFEIRRAGPGDADTVAALFDAYRQFYRYEPDHAGARVFVGERLRRADSVIFVAEGEGGPLGFTQLYPSFTSTGMARIYILNDLFVAPEARGCGVGASLLRHAAGFARGEGAIRLALSTERTNATAQALYEREGWRRDDAFLSYTLPL